MLTHIIQRSIKTNSTIGS